LREIIENAHKHMDDGYGRAQAAARQQRPKRFYKNVSVGGRDGLFRIELDGRATKTPGKVPVLVPSRDLAQLMAAEWEAQESHIDASTMPVVRLVNSAIEGGKKIAAPLRRELIKYAGNDLLLFRADGPRELVNEQERHWDAVLATLARHFEIKFHPIVGIIHSDQPANTLARLARSLEDADYFALSALVSLTGLTGSGLLAIALRHALIDAEAAWTAAHVDEDHNARLWGADKEAEARLAKRRVEFDAAITVLGLVDAKLADS